jgi:phosphohistidine phosphatase SixA
MRRSVVLAAILLSGASRAAAQRVVFVVRHAEKATSANDPGVPLSEAGRARGQRLARILEDAGVTAIFSTDYRRTRETAEPIARSRRLEIRTYAAKDASGRQSPEELVRTLSRDFSGDAVLVVGHSDTVPALVRALGCRADVAIGPDEYDNLFIVVPRPGSDPALLRLRF